MSVLDHIAMAPASFQEFADTVSATRFERLFHESRARALSMALQLTNNRAEAEDLLQETYCKAWQAFRTFDDQRSFLNWLLRILQRVNLDARRRHNPIRCAESLNAMLSTANSEPIELPVPDSRPTPDLVLIRHEERDILLNCLRQLPALYRQVIVLCDFEDMSYAQIAAVQKSTVGTVRSRIHRARKMLRQLIVQSGLVTEATAC